MGIANDLASLDATAQADLVRKGDVTSLELVEAAIAATEQINPRINAIIHPRFETAVAEAGFIAIGRTNTPPDVMSFLILTDLVGFRPWQ